MTSAQPTAPLVHGQSLPTASAIPAVGDGGALPTTSAVVDGESSAASSWSWRDPVASAGAGVRSIVDVVATHADIAVLAVAVVIGAVLRMVNLSAVGLNSDEAVYASQAGSLAGNPHFTQLFPVVRAHPLLLQMLMSPLYAHGVPDTAGRYVVAAFSVGTIVLVYAVGRTMFGPMAGAFAALVLAVMPYDVTISREILLDGPMTFFLTAALLALAAAGRTNDGRYLVAAGAGIGVAALTKEPAVIMVGAGYAFVALTWSLWRPMRWWMLAVLLAVGLTASYPLLTGAAGGSASGGSYLVWQLTRQSNHSPAFYPTSVGAAIGFAVLAVAAVGLILFRRWTWRERLLLAWIAVPALFFELWPTKGFSYLLPIAPAVAILAARAVSLFWSDAALRSTGAHRLQVPRFLRHPRTRLIRRASAAVIAVALVATLAVPAVAQVVAPPNLGLAGAGGTPGGRPAGRWVAENAPEGAAFITIGPSMANLIAFYGGRRADALSVSPNPLHRNPSYHPVPNADAALRAGDYQYIVWDAYSAARSSTFDRRARELIDRFHGHIVDVQRGEFQGRPDQVLVAIYKVTP